MTGALHDGAVTGSRRGIWLAAAAAALVAFGADLLTKVAVRDRIVPGEEIDLFAGVTLVHTTNRGIAFGILPNRPVLIAIATSVALCVIAFALIAFARRSLPVLTTVERLGSSVTSPSPARRTSASRIGVRDIERRSARLISSIGSPVRE